MNKILIFVLMFVSTNIYSNDIWFKKNKKNKKETTSKISKYNKLLKKSSVDKGIFDVLNEGTNYYFNIPDSLLNVDFLIVNKLSKVPSVLNEAGLNKGMEFEHKVIQFVKNAAQKKVYIMCYKPFVESDDNSKIKESVNDNYSKSILEYLDIEAFSKDSTNVIVKVNKVYDGSSTSINNVFGDAGSPIKNLSYLDTIKSFPNNIVVKSVQTAKVYGEKASVNVTSNIVLLPKKPMVPRFEDNRIGFFSCPRWYFNDKQHSLEKRRLITRWRLEPKDKEAYFKGELTEPIKPIVFYIDPATPTQWVEYIKQGVADWQKAFETAGFKNAIYAKEVTDEKDFDIDDVRYSAITYVASEKSNAMGPSVFDPRSGEILESDVIWWHNVMTSVQSWMRVQTGIIDPKSRANKFTDEHMGEAIRFISSHEIGHTLGLKHNMRASYSYPVDSLRSESFCKKMATATSIMDYARFNYVAQPEDSVKSITPKIGIYDKYAIAWAYKYYPDSDAHKEIKYSNEWIKKHNNNPYCVYLPQQGMRTAIDPRAQSEDLGNNSVLASNYGLKNLKRTIPLIIDWTTKDDESYLEAGKLINAVIGQWYRYSYHVLTNIGGVYINNTRFNDGKKTYTFVEKEKQKQAVKYIIDNVFVYPAWLFDNNIYDFVYPIKDSPKGYREYSPFSTFRNMQSYIMWDMFTNDRLDRMIANEMKNKDKAYTVANLLNDVHKAVFKKTITGENLDIAERATQKEFIDALIIAVNKISVSKQKKSLTINNENNFSSEVIFSGPKRISEAISLKRGELLRIEKLLKKQKSTNINMATRYHYEDLLLRINQALR